MKSTQILLIRSSYDAGQNPEVCRPNVKSLGAAVSRALEIGHAHHHVLPSEVVMLVCKNHDQSNTECCVEQIDAAIKMALHQQGG